jgi:tellurite methyltransferase
MSEADRSKWDQRYRDGAYAGRTHPNALLAEWVDRIPRGRALDVACGAGRNALFLAARGFDVDAVDISRAGLDRAREHARAAGLEVNWIEHDLDTPLALDAEYALILVARYVNLPLISALTEKLAPDGFLVCEQHLATQAEVAGPSNPAFRVTPGELRAAARGLMIHYEDEGVIDDPDGRPVALARLVAQRTAAPSY